MNSMVYLAIRVGSLSMALAACTAEIAGTESEASPVSPREPAHSVVVGPTAPCYDPMGTGDCHDSCEEVQSGPAVDWCFAPGNITFPAPPAKLTMGAIPGSCD